MENEDSLLTNSNSVGPPEKKSPSNPYIITTCTIYGIFIFLFFLLTIINLWTRYNELLNPVSSNLFTNKQYDQLVYPSITLCNIFPDIPLIHNKCQNFQQEFECIYKKDIFSFSKKNVKKLKGKDFHCLTYNDDIENAFVASKTGIQAMLIISVKINTKDYQKDFIANGLMISLHAQNKFDSNFDFTVSPGEIYLIKMKKKEKEFLNSTIKEEFEGKINVLGSFNFEEKWGQRNDTVVVGFTYQDLNVDQIKEMAPYSILNFLSETGGVLSLLLGSSILNVIIILLQWGWGLRLNDLKWLCIGKTDEREEENKSENEEEKTVLI